MRRFSTIAAAVVFTLGACAHPSRITAGSATSATTATTTTTDSPVTATASGAPFSLYTHCGIRELTWNGAWYQRVGGILDDGQGNPPRGWDNPFQRGVLTLAGGTAVFTDSRGHRESFALRPGATRPLVVCS